MRIRHGEHLTDTEAGAVVGFSYVDGPQYRIVTPARAEVVHALTGAVTYVDKDGRLYPLKKGDVLFIAPDLANSAREGKNYTHHYVVFPMKPLAGTSLPPMAMLNPARLAASDYQNDSAGAWHTFFVGAGGVSVKAWRAARKGTAANTSHVTFLAVTSGSGELDQGGVVTRLAAGDTIVIPRGSAYHWRSDGLTGIVVDC